MKQLKQNQMVHSSVEVLRVQKLSELNNPVVMAKGIHLFPSRTQQLSPYTSKVLGWKRPGRIDSCRLKKIHHIFRYGVFFYFIRSYLSEQVSWEKRQFLIANFLLYQYSLMSNALLCLGKEVPRNPPALHAGPPRFFARTKKLSKKCFAISSLRGVSTTFACYRTTQSKLRISMTPYI